MKNNGEPEILCYAEFVSRTSVTEESHVSPSSTVLLDARTRQSLAGIESRFGRRVGALVARHDSGPPLWLGQRRYPGRCPAGAVVRYCSAAAARVLSRGRRQTRLQPH